MATLKAKPRKTVEDFMSLPEGARAELIEGEIYVSPSPRPWHQIVLLNIATAFRAFVLSGRFGQTFVAPLDVHLPSGDIVQPDVIFVSNANQSIIQDWIRGTPDLLVEVISPGSPERDRIVKRRLYAENGVKEYWIVDPEARSVEVLTVADGAYVSHGYFEGEGAVTSRVLGDLSLPLAEIFASQA